jgi:hypothetical protein
MATVQLMPDRSNKFDRNAVGVWAGPRASTAIVQAILELHHVEHLVYRG